MTTREDVDKLLKQFTPAELFIIALSLDDEESRKKHLQLLKENPDILKSLFTFPSENNNGVRRSESNGSLSPVVLSVFSYG